MSENEPQRRQLGAIRFVVCGIDKEHIIPFQVHKVKIGKLPVADCRAHLVSQCSTSSSLKDNFHFSDVMKPQVCKTSLSMLASSVKA